MVVVDQHVRFDVFADAKCDHEMRAFVVTGTVYEVNYAHQVFHVAYSMWGKELRTSFKFCDIGNKVWAV